MIAWLNPRIFCNCKDRISVLLMRMFQPFACRQVVEGRLELRPVDLGMGYVAAKAGIRVIWGSKLRDIV